MTHDYLADLNQEQRRAVKHGVKGGAVDSRPLLVIAGAGSGKTKTLAHRVAHLVVNGIDPRRGLSPSMPSALASCGSMPTASASSRRSRSSTGRMLRI